MLCSISNLLEISHYIKRERKCRFFIVLTYVHTHFYIWWGFNDLKLLIEHSQRYKEHFDFIFIVSHYIIIGNSWKSGERKLSCIRIDHTKILSEWCYFLFSALPSFATFLSLFLCNYYPPFGVTYLLNKLSGTWVLYFLNRHIFELA